MLILLFVVTTLVVASVKETADTQGAPVGVTHYYEPLLLSLTD